jgi:hypothetical protein
MIIVANKQTPKCAYLSNYWIIYACILSAHLYGDFNWITCMQFLIKGIFDLNKKNWNENGKSPCQDFIDHNSYDVPLQQNY